MQLLALMLTLWSTAAFAVEAPGNTMAVQKPLKERLQVGSSIPDVLTRRDPFLRPRNPDAPLIVESDAPAPVAAPVVAESPNKIDMSAPELERYDASTYQLVAVLLGDVYPRALVKVPSSRKVYVVREKDRIGNRNGKVRDIQEGQMVVSEVTKQSAGGYKRSEVVLEIKGGEIKK